jgi:hypothetical protein
MWSRCVQLYRALGLCIVIVNKWNENEINTGNFTVYHPPTSTRIPLNSRQQPATIDLVLVPVLFEMEVTVQCEMSDFFNFDYKHANLNLFRQILD